MNTHSNTITDLSRLQALQADPFRAAELHRMQEDAANGLRDLTRHLALHLAVSTAPPRQGRQRRSMAAGKQREQRARACQALAEEMILQALIHLHDPQWDPATEDSTARSEAAPSVLLALLQMAGPVAADGPEDQQEDEAWMEPWPGEQHS